MRQEKKNIILVERNSCYANWTQYYYSKNMAILKHYIEHAMNHKKLMKLCFNNILEKDTLLMDIDVKKKITFESVGMLVSQEIQSQFQKNG